MSCRIRQPNGQWLKSIKFKLPIIEEDMSVCSDNDTQVKLVSLVAQQDKQKKLLQFSSQYRMEVAAALLFSSGGINLHFAVCIWIKCFLQEAY